MTGNVLLLTIIFLPFAAAFTAYSAGRKSERLRDVVVFTAITLTFALSLFFVPRYQGVESRLVDFGAFALHFRADNFRVLYACITAFLWLVTTIFSPEYFSHSKNTNRYWLFNLISLGAVMGVFFSADFRTAFLFFEIMAFSSYALVAHDESPKALRAAETYLSVSIICGLVQLMGMWMLHTRIGTLEFARLYEISAGMPDKSLFYLPGALLLIGFGAKAGMYPLHIWLPKAHPVAPAPASALLSGIFTKTGVFGVAVMSANIFVHDQAWGTALLIPAVITMVLGAVLGVFSNDLKRTLACSSVSQIGFILTGAAMLILLGDYNTFAIRGMILHMLNHSLFKLVLFLAAGVVYLNLHALTLDKIRGFGRGKPLFLFVFLMAALGITGVPLWSGFISKALLKKSLSEGYYLFQGVPLEFLLRFSYWALVITGGLTFAYMTKLFVSLFVEKSETSDEAAAHHHTPHHEGKTRYISVPSAIALAASAALVPLLGSFPGVMDSLAGFGEGFFYGTAPEYATAYLTWYNIRGAMTSIAIGAGIYLLVVRGLLTRGKAHVEFLPAWLDLENLIYRPALSFLAEKPSLFLHAFISLPTVLAQSVRPHAGHFFHSVATLPDTLANNARPHADNFFHSVASLPDTLANNTLPHAGEKLHFLVRIMAKVYGAFSRRLRAIRENPAIVGHFSLDLLFLGIGVCVALVYVLFRAFS